MTKKVGVVLLTLLWVLTVGCGVAAKSGNNDGILTEEHENIEMVPPTEMINDETAPPLDNVSVMTPEKSEEEDSTVEKNHSLGTWVWNAMVIVQSPDETLAFLSEQGVTEIYISRKNSIKLDIYRKFISDANKLGIRTALIGEDMNWIKPENYDNYQAFWDWFVEYQNGCEDDSQKFYGFHFDVEPQNFDDWRKGYKEYVQLYADWIRHTAEKCAEIGAYFELDIPTWWDDRAYNVTDADGTSFYLDDFCFKYADRIVYMNYQNSGVKMFQRATRGVELAVKYQKPVVFGAETGNVPAEPDITFYNLGSDKLYAELAIFKEMIANTYDYEQIGYAIHWLYPWSTLPKEGR